MKNKFLKFPIVLILCLVILSGCAVVPSSTPEITPTPEATPTPAPTPETTPLINTINKYKAKLSNYNYHWWIDKVDDDQKLEIKVFVYLQYTTLDKFIKKYGFEEQFESIPLDESHIHGLIVDMKLLAEIISDSAVSGIIISKRLDKNGVVMPNLVRDENGKLYYPPYTYDEDGNLISPKGPAYDEYGNMVYDENGKRVVSGN